MKSYRDIGYRLIKCNKKRNFSIFISVVICSFITFGLLSVFKNFSEDSINAAKRYGDYMASFKEVSLTDYEKLKENINIEKSCAYQKYKINYLREEYKRNFDINLLEIYDLKNQQIFSYDIVSGEYPKNEDEIMIERDLLHSLDGDYDVGSEIFLDVVINGEVKKQKFNISGFFEYDKNQNDSYLIISSMNKDKEAKSMNVFVSYKKYDDIVKSTEKISHDHSIKIDGYNNELLKALNQDKKDIREIILKISVFIIIILISEIIIRNAISISVKENVKNFGILKCIGASNKHIRKIVTRYSLIVAAISSFCGIVIAYFTLKGITYFSNNVFGYKVNVEIKFYFEIAILSFVFLMISVFIAFMEPFELIKKINVVDCVSGNFGISTSRVKKRNNILIRKLFGIEGEYAYKNVMRNNHKFLLRFAGLTISVAIMVSVNSISNSVTKEMEKDINLCRGYYDFLVARDLSDDSSDEIGKLKDINCVLDARKYECQKVRCINEGFDYCDEYKENNSMMDYKNKSISVDKINDDEYDLIKKYVVSGDLDSKIGDDEIVLMNCVNKHTEEGVMLDEKIQIRDIDINKYIDIVDDNYLKENDYNNQDEVRRKEIEGEARKLGKVKSYRVKAIIEQNPLYLSESCIGFLSDEGYKKIDKYSMYDKELDEYLIKVKDCREVEELKQYINSNVKYIDMNFIYPYGSMIDDIETLKLYSNIICILIGFISIFNITNTIMSNQISRKKEYALLRIVGMNKKKLFKMIFLEGNIVSVVSIIFGVSIGLFFGYYILDNYIFYLLPQWTYHVSVKSIVFISLIIFTISVFSSIIVLFKQKKSDLINEIRTN